MKVRFEEDELFVIAIFKMNSRTETIEEIRRICPFVEEDAEMLTLVNSTLEKMEQLTDQEFSAMDLEEYRQEAAEDES